MIVYKFFGNTSSVLKAFSIDKDGGNLPNVFNDKPVIWKFIEEIDASNELNDFSKEWLKEVAEKGFIISNPKLDFYNERTEPR